MEFCEARNAHRAKLTSIRLSARMERLDVENKLRDVAVKYDGKRKDLHAAYTEEHKAETPLEGEFQ